MKIHIVGAGPTGLSLAWELLRTGEHDVTIYDRKLSAGGSWWEPDVDTRDLHAHRIVFDRAFVNTKSFFEEMDIKWDDMFELEQEDGSSKYIFEKLQFQDYKILSCVFTKVFWNPKKYKNVSLKDVLGEDLTPDGKKILEHLPLIMDGVTWDVMSAYEFVQNLNHVMLSKKYTQRVSGKVMCDAMEEAVMNAGANFVFGTELLDVEYGKDSFVAKFTGERVIDDGLLFLCLDNSPALNILGTNWGPDTDKQLRRSTYGAINVLLDYDEPITLKSDLEIAIETRWNLQPKVLSDGKTVACVICDLGEDVMRSDPETLIEEVIRQLKVPKPISSRIGWGAEWKENKWHFSQSSGVLSLHGQLPFFGKCSKVAMCGMMSPRETPYSSIEASVEVSRALSHMCFGTRKPLRPLLVSQVLLFTFVLLIVLLVVYNI
jgi:hypothetical protein